MQKRRANVSRLRTFGELCDELVTVLCQSDELQERHWIERTAVTAYTGRS
jgi:hypothetical protein